MSGITVHTQSIRSVLWTKPNTGRSLAYTIALNRAAFQRVRPSPSVQLSMVSRTVALALGLGSRFFGLGLLPIPEASTKP
tara:strand:- start:287 stop:526 length:240 start_codon:yes stop_codon:yes gene_type:complete